MDSIFAVKGKDFVLIAADNYSMNAIIRQSNQCTKLKNIDQNKVLGLSGLPADRELFSEYVLRNMHLNRIRQGFPMSTHAIATFSRTELAASLREQPCQVNILLAGVDDDGPHLYWIDYLASMVELPKAAHGFASYFLLGILDRYYKPNLTQEEALDICKKCIQELRDRCILSQTEFSIKIVKKEGIDVVSI